MRYCALVLLVCWLPSCVPAAIVGGSVIMKRSQKASTSKDIQQRRQEAYLTYKTEMERKNDERKKAGEKVLYVMPYGEWEKANFPPR